jgi:CRP/FNR family cyclic AMP-dependent transcriptional regulator
MFTIVEPPSEFEPLNRRCGELLAEILSLVTIKPETFKLRSSTPLYSTDQSKDYFYIVREGNLAYTLRDRTLFYFQEGDCIGFEKELDVYTPIISSDFAVVLDRYSQKAFLDQVHSEPRLQILWQEFLGRYIAALYVVARSLFKDSETVVPEVRSYNQGDIIIEQGSKSDEVLTLADGIAEITKNGQKVGQLSSDDVFGVLSALTNTSRDATVIATTDCLVLSMDSKSYLELLSARPQLVHTLLTDMANTIVNSQNQLAGALIKL